MKGRLVELTFTLDGRQRLVLELEEDFRKTFADLKDRDVRIEVKRWRKKRSLDANAYAWVLIEFTPHARARPPLSKQLGVFLCCLFCDDRRCCEGIGIVPPK